MKLEIDGRLISLPENSVTTIVTDADFGGGVIIRVAPRADAAGDFTPDLDWEQDLADAAGDFTPDLDWEQDLADARLDMYYDEDDFSCGCPVCDPDAAAPADSDQMALVEARDLIYDLACQDLGRNLMAALRDTPTEVVTYLIRGLRDGLYTVHASVTDRD